MATMSLKPFTLFTIGGSPNPWKVALVLEALDVPYNMETMALDDLHTPVFEKYNPNGRLPALVDHNNNDFTIWESGAIIEYIVAKYDTQNKLSSPSGSDNSFLEKQYLHFQMSGQGPYFGQGYWFANYHPEYIEGNVERYRKEIKRIFAVLDAILADKEYLVGGRLSYADLAFIPWFWTLRFNDANKGGLQDVYKEAYASNPNTKAWLDRLYANPVVDKISEDRMAASKAFFSKNKPAFNPDKTEQK